MARTEHLPLYKTAYDLCLYLEQVVRNFSRYHKYALGADLREGARRGWAERAQEARRAFWGSMRALWHCWWAPLRSRVTFSCALAACWPPRADLLSWSARLLARP